MDRGGRRVIRDDWVTQRRVIFHECDLPLRKKEVSMESMAPGGTGAIFHNLTKTPGILLRKPTTPRSRVDRRCQFQGRGC